MPTNLDAAAQLAREQQFATGRDFKMALQEIAQGTHGESLQELTPENQARVADFIFEDAMEAVQDNQNAIGWYDDAVTRAKTEFAKLYPEIAEGGEAEFAFIWGLAVTSNGLKVNDNFRLAAKVYEEWKSTGSFPKKAGTGTAARQIDNGLAAYQKLIDELGGWEAARDFMVREQTVREIEAQQDIFKISGEGKGETIRGAGILGPKIGNGFFSNLYGYFDGLTMDRWLMRSVGRWRGSLISINTDMIAKKSDEIRTTLELNGANANGALFGAIRDGLTGPMQAQFDAVFPDGTPDQMTQEQTEAFSVFVAKASVKPAWRTAFNKLPGGDTIRKAGNGLAKYLDGQVEAPAGAGERTFIRGAFKDALERLQQQPGMEALTMADLQALLWYPEKLLYESAKKPAGEEIRSYTDDEAPDYGNAARDLVARRLGTDRDAGAGRPDARGADVSGRGGGEGSGGSTGGVATDGGRAGRALQQGDRGEIIIPIDGVLTGTTVIELFQSSDLSTFLHESGHFFLEAFQAVATMQDAPQSLRTDLQTIYDWVGKTDDGPFTTEQQEMWAEAFETYLMQGKAPSPTLKAAFAKFARWLTDLFKRGKISGFRATPEIEEVMSRMLATQDEIDVVKEETDAKPLFDDIPPGMSEQEFETYQRVAARGDAEAESRLLERSMEKIRRRRKKEYATRRAQIEEEVAETFADFGRSAITGY